MEVSTKWQREWRLGRPWFSIPGIVASTTSHCRIGVATSSAPARSVEIGRLPSLSSSSSDPLDYGRTTGSFKPAECPSTTGRHLPGNCPVEIQRLAGQKLLDRFPDAADPMPETPSICNDPAVEFASG